MGALLIAARAYLRQVNDARAAQASMVFVYSREFEAVVETFNQTPIYDVCIFYSLPGGKPELVDYAQRLDQQNCKLIADAPGPLDYPGTKVWATFVDGSGNGWVRHVDGRLKALPKSKVPRPG